jgi:2-dehydro-3-deoxyphosphogluconate aldolase/(4S)-4-hydroxy-2-oxoglutarate aldolase
VTGDELRSALAERGVVAVLRARSAERAVEAGRALVAGGVRALEVTFTVPDAPAAIERLAADADVLVGAGTVLTAAHAAAAVEAGARFIVSPHFDEEVLDAARALGVPAVPGVLTPTEVARAARRCSVVKLFPASLGGPALLSALRGPFPTLAVVPTGGVTAANLRDWVAAGALAIGAGTDLCPTEAVERGDSRALEARAARYMASFAAARDDVAAPAS